MTIRHFCETFAASHQISLAAFAASLGYKSANSLYRIMDNNVRIGSLNDFRDKLTDTYPLSEEETAQLKSMLAEKIFGADKKSLYDAISRFLTGEETIPGEPDQAYLPLLSRYRDCTQVSMLMYNSVHPDVINACRLLLQSGVSITHYIHAPEKEAEVVQTMNVLKPILFHARYNVLLKHHDPEGAATVGVLNGLEKADVAWVSYTDPAGQGKREVILFQPEGPVFFTSGKVPRPPHTDRYSPVKQQWRSSNGFADYIDFCRNCAELDKKHAIYMIKPDFCYGLVDGQHLENLIVRHYFAEEEGFDQVLSILREIFDKRFSDNMHRRKHFWCAMRLSALEQFMQTGYLSDHLWAMRPFTEQERVEVITAVLEGCQANHHLHLLLLRDEEALYHDEIDLYQGHGLLLHSHNKDYDFADNYEECLICDPVMMQAFTDYYLRVIVRDLCYSESESLERMQALIQ